MKLLQIDYKNKGFLYNSVAKEDLMDEKNTMETSHIFNVNEMINYERGAVVSRTLIDRNTGTVTLFSFDKGQGLSEHTAPFDALVYVIDGSVDIMIASEKYHLEKDQIIIMPANKPHSLKGTERFKMLLIMIK